MQMPGQIVISTNVDYNNEYTVIIVNKQLYSIIIIITMHIAYCASCVRLVNNSTLWNDYEIPDFSIAE